jgi:26S proteasome regulatory subunit N8
VCSYASNPLLVIIDVQPKELGIPTKAYYAVEEVKEDATQKSQKAFVHVASEIGAYEAEEIGVEHLLRDVKDATISTLATEVPSCNHIRCCTQHFNVEGFSDFHR